MKITNKTGGTKLKTAKTKSSEISKGSSKETELPKAGRKVASSEEPTRKARTGLHIRFNPQFALKSKGREIHGVQVQDSEYFPLEDCPTDFQAWVIERRPWCIDPR